MLKKITRAAEAHIVVRIRGISIQVEREHTRVSPIVPITSTKKNRQFPLRPSTFAQTDKLQSCRVEKNTWRVCSFFLMISSLNLLDL